MRLLWQSVKKFARGARDYIAVFSPIMVVLFLAGEYADHDLFHFTRPIEVSLLLTAVFGGASLISLRRDHVKQSRRQRQLRRLQLRAVRAGNR